jgi:hypothetical protein
MRKSLILLIFPLLVFSHIKDERLFTTANVPSAAMILIDRSGSMNDPTYHYEDLVRLNDYNNGNTSSTLSGWYDSTLVPDGPGAMGDFVGGDPNAEWILEVEWYNFWTWRTPRVDLTWTLTIRAGGSWHTYSGGSHTWYGRFGNQRLSIDLSGYGLGIIEEVQCYLDIDLDYMDIEDMQIDLIKTPRDVPYESTRIKDAILVIHSLLDADNDGFVTEADEDFLTIKLGQGFHREGKTGDVFIPLSSYTSYYDSDLGERYNETTCNWDNVGSGTMYTDTIGAHFSTIWDHVRYTDNGGFTPNGMLVSRARTYINNYRTSHPDLWCMSHNIIIITDGESNQPRVECSDGSRDLVRQSYRAWHQDSIKVFAVGFGTGITSGGANELNWASFHGGTQSADSAFIDSMISNNLMDTTDVNASTCGMSLPSSNFLTGYAYIAEDANALASALGRIFMEIAGGENKSFTAAEVTSVEEEFLSTQYQSRLYIASFLPDTTPVWKGNLRAVKMIAGDIDLDNIPDSILIWAAGDTIGNSAADSRPIYGINSAGNKRWFDTLNFTPAELGVSAANRASVIDAVRDGGTNDNLGELGDIFHSSPLRIQSPNYFFEDQGWDSFYNVMSKKRSSIIYAGGNDGMLHVFADTINGQGGKGGHEIVGIIPMNFIPEVKNLLVAHDYFMDGDPMAADVWFPASDIDSIKDWDEWHTILIATQGEGGRSFMALDVTDPLNETTHPANSIDFKFDAWQNSSLRDTLGYTTSTPIIYKVGVNWSGFSGRVIDRFYGFVGGGQFPDPMDISIVDSIDFGEVDGNVIIAFDVWKAATNGIDSNFILIPPAEGGMDYPFVASAAVININPEFGNRYDFLFIPDAAGQLWFVDLRFPNPTDWKARKIFQSDLPTSGDTAQIYHWHPAFYHPLIWKDPAYGGYWIAYGTGNRSDVFAESAERFYALHYPVNAFNDTSAVPLYTESDLGTPGYPESRGWMLELTHDREKVVTQAVYFQDSLEFYTFSPGGATDIGPCDIGGTGSVARSYCLHIRTGSGNAAGVAIGSGMPQPPSYSFSISGEGKKIIQSGGKIEVKDIGSFMSFRQHILWKDEDRD